MPRNGDDLEVLVELVAFGEGRVYVADLSGRRRIVLMDVKRGVERVGDPVAGGGGFMVVVEILARDAAEGAIAPLQRLGSVDEQVAWLALEQERADLERGPEPQRFGFRGVQAWYHGIHEGIFSSLVDLATVAQHEARWRIPTCHASSPGCGFALARSLTGS